MTSPETKYVQIKIPLEVWRRLRHAATDEMVPVSVLVKRAVYQAVNYVPEQGALATHLPASFHPGCPPGQGTHPTHSEEDNSFQDREQAQ